MYLIREPVRMYNIRPTPGHAGSNIIFPSMSSNLFLFVMLCKTFAEAILLATVEPMTALAIMVGLSVFGIWVYSAEPTADWKGIFFFTFSFTVALGWLDWRTVPIIMIVGLWSAWLNKRSVDRHFRRQVENLLERDGQY